MSSEVVSLYFDSQWSSNSNIQFPNFNFNKTYDVQSYRVTGVQFPVSVQNVNASNNTFKVNGTLFTIPEGNYTVNSFASALQTAVTPTISGFTVTANTTTGKLTFANATAIQIDTTTSGIWKLLGFPITTITGSATSLTSANSIDLSGAKAYYLCSSALRSDNLNLVAQPSRNVIAVIPATQSNGDFLSASFEMANWLPSPQKLQSMDLFFINGDTLQPLEMFGGTFSCSIDFLCHVPDY